jgi:hypothetical protein
MKINEKEKREAVNLLKKWSKDYITHLTFVEGPISLYGIDATLEIAIDEENYEMASLYKKLKDIKFYKEPEHPHSVMIIEYLKRTEKLYKEFDIENKSKDILNSDFNELDFESKKIKIDLTKAKLKDIKKQQELNLKCIDNIEKKIVKNPFDESDKFHAQFEYFRTKSLNKYYNELENNYIKIQDIENKIKLYEKN